MKKRFSLIDIAFGISVLIPLAISLKTILFGHIPFWYDPARDLLLGLDNLKKPTLLGPPTGIPDIFYGPYWIWLISAGLVLSKDPRFVTFFVAALPYFVILPGLFYLLAKKVFDKSTMVIVWLFFILSYISYTNKIWNPNLAPLIFVALVFVISIFKPDTAIHKKMILQVFILGILQGLLLNFHISFGIGIFLSTFIFLFIQMLLQMIKTKKYLYLCRKYILIKIVYIAGVSVMFLPTLLFEIRHGFTQLKSVLFTLSQAFIHNSSVVGQVGLNKPQIFTAFTDRLAQLVQLPPSLTVFIAIILFTAVIIEQIKSRQKTNWGRINILLFVVTSSISLLIVYTTSKNPVWGYHFIGVEILFIFLIGLFLTKHEMVKRVVAVWVTVLLVINVAGMIKSLIGERVYSDLSAEVANVESIFADSKKIPFTYMAKNAAIYTYEYDYLFRWLGKKYNHIPGNVVGDSKLVYLIIPADQIFDKVGFVENRTPSNRYVTAKEWYGKEKVLIIRREVLPGK